MIQPPHSINLSGLNHRETSLYASAFHCREGKTGRSEGIRCRCAVVVAQMFTGCGRGNEMLTHLYFPQNDAVSVYLSGIEPASLKIFMQKKITDALNAGYQLQGTYFAWL